MFILCSSSFNSNTSNADARSISLNLIVSPSFSFTPSDGDSTHPAPSSPKMAEGWSSNDADIVRAEDLSPMAASMRAFEFLAHIPPCIFTTYSADVFLRNLKGSPHAQEVQTRHFQALRREKRCTASMSSTTAYSRWDSGFRPSRAPRSHSFVASIHSAPWKSRRNRYGDHASGSTPICSPTEGEATLEPPLQVSLLDFMRILEVMLDECGSYTVACSG
ncbi:uncharacterized protein EI90DRAFT_3123057 [Cantharellus anzutake]|uniref:uncharacterized protein n=1 Tax=Cantharellus anzutake TaxID=1750568 RepID=UPI0019030675|nr:uncharacterized protein EI90DRAFT_3123057 [Cantharellus anzutake]KAF8331957.1 hypothetical protein EI90DRAFT_3123057 [Cantharellus anzutake]